MHQNVPTGLFVYFFLVQKQLLNKNNFVSQFIHIIYLGHEFIVKRDHALTSGTIKAMLSGPGQFAENETNEVNFREIPSHVLQKVNPFKSSGFLRRPQKS